MGWWTDPQSDDLVGSRVSPSTRLDLRFPLGFERDRFFVASIFHFYYISY